jgi:ATP synthase protein I
MPKPPLASYAIYLAAGVQLAASTVAGLVAGYYVDKKLGTDPWLTAAGVMLGFIGGMVNLFRIVRLIEKER